MINAVIRVHDTGGVVSKTILKNIPSASAVDMTTLGVFAQTLVALCNGGVSEYALLTWTETAQVPTVVTPTGVNSFKAAIRLRYVIGGTQKTALIWMPNPANTAIEMVVGEGYRLTQVALDALTAAFTACAGFAVTAVQGKILTKSWSATLSRSHSSIQFIDSALEPGYMGIPRDLCVSSGALVTLTAALDAANLSASQIDRSFFCLHQSVTPDQTTGMGLAVVDGDDLKFTSVEVAAIAKFSYETSGIKKFEKVNMPSIMRNYCLRSNSKYKLDPAIGADVATALTTLYGSGNKEVTFVGSKVVGVDLDSQ